MRRVMLASLLLVLLFRPGLAEAPPKPIVEVRLEESEAIPGQSVSMRLSVLVPTWLSKPVDFPSFDLANLRVIVGDRSTTPISRPVEGAQWSGVSRHYLLSPMVPGVIRIPSQSLAVSYAEPGKIDPVQADVETPPLSVTGIVPEAARGLSPFIAAQALTLTQEVSSPTTGLKAGDSVVRTLTATIEGASPIVLPPLLGEERIDGIRPYAAEPQVRENSTESGFSGTRVEQVTYMAESGGEGMAGGVRLAWFNLQTRQIEETAVPGFPLSVAAAPGRTGLSSLSWKAWLALAVVPVAMLVLLRWGWPRVSRRFAILQQARRSSPAGARRRLLTALRRRDFPQTLRALDAWSKQLAPAMQAALPQVSDSLLAIGRCRYGRFPEPTPATCWKRLKHAVSNAPPVTTGRRSRQVLPMLNPATPSGGS